MLLEGSQSLAVELRRVDTRETWFSNARHWVGETDGSHGDGCTSRIRTLLFPGSWDGAGVCKVANARSKAFTASETYRTVAASSGRRALGGTLVVLVRDGGSSMSGPTTSKGKLTCAIGRNVAFAVIVVDDDDWGWSSDDACAMDTSCTSCAINLSCGCAVGA